MFWRKNDNRTTSEKREDKQRNKELNNALGGRNTPADIGYDMEAFKLRGKRERDSLKRDSTTRPQLVNEENKAIEIAKQSETKTSKDGKTVAKKSVDKKWWEKL